MLCWTLLVVCPALEARTQETAREVAHLVGIVRGWLASLGIDDNLDFELHSLCQTACIASINTESHFSCLLLGKKVFIIYMSVCVLS